MRALLIAVLITSVSVPALAQGMGRGKGAGPAQSGQPQRAKPKVDEGAYRAALDKIPNQRPADPWGNVRPVPPSPK